MIMGVSARCLAAHAGRAAVVGLSLAAVGLHVAAGRAYGYFSDEVYYLACAAHLDWGYVDFPPLLPVAGKG
jgi:hypothetical protein